MTTYDYPGVYIEEDASLALSVSQGSTAIPVFIGCFLPKKTSTTPKIIRVSSWLDFTNQFHVGCVTSIAIKSTSLPAAKKPKKVEKVEGDISAENKAAKEGNKEVNSNTETEEEKKADYSYEVTIGTYTTSSDALKLYFQNGGGPCYILPIADTNNTTLALIPKLIEQALEITLIVCPEQDSDYQSKIYNSLTSSLLNTGYFLIADNQDKTSAISTNVSSQTATYYPAVKVSQLMQTEESLIAVSGYKEAKANNVTNLAELKEKNPDVYHVLSGISDVAERLTDDDQKVMNSKGINAIRYFSNKGFVVWGARTLKDDDNWRYIPVRRLFNAAERDIKQAMRIAVFEPNSQPTWERVRSAIDNYLHQLWQQGALVGSNPQEAYFVQIGQGITMSEVDIKQGRMISRLAWRRSVRLNLLSCNFRKK